MPDAMDFSRLAGDVAAILKAGGVLADEKPLAAIPSPRDLREALAPVLTKCCHAPMGTPTGRRRLIGIAAPPGAGKTTFVAWLAATVKALGWKGIAFAALDGYHLPNAVLDSRTGADPDGNPVSLRKLKGTPPSFDAERLLADLRALKDSRVERHLPVYSRVLHEPVPDRIVIGPEVDCIFVEGNFLFLDTPPWREIRALFDRRIFLDADDDTLKARLAQRHAQAGRDAAWIEAHLRRTDWPNVCLVRRSAPFADIVLRFDPKGGLNERL